MPVLVSPSDEIVEAVSFTAGNDYLFSPDDNLDDYDLYVCPALHGSYQLVWKLDDSTRTNCTYVDLVTEPVHSTAAGMTFSHELA